MSLSERLEAGKQAGAQSWREGTRGVNWGGGLVALLLLAAGIGGIALIHPWVGVPLVFLSLIVLYKSGFQPTNYTPSDS